VIEMQNTSGVRAPAMSFILRLWPDSDGESAMRGEIENVGTGEKRAFLDYRSLLKLLDSWREDAETAR
jgi:hypothetical protein